MESERSEVRKVVPEHEDIGGSGAKAVEAKRVGEVLQEWMQHAGGSFWSLCGVGVRNDITTMPLVGPQMFIDVGRVVHGTPDEVAWTMAAAMLFGTGLDESGKFSGGLVAYDIGSTRAMVVVAWQLGHDDRSTLYNALVMPHAKCDEALFRSVMQTASTAEREVVHEDDGFLVMARISVDHGAKAVLVVDIANNENPLGSAIPVKATGRALEESCKSLLAQCSAKVACSVGIRNTSPTVLLTNGRTLLETGRCILEPAQTLGPQRATPSLFAKNPNALRGVSGCIAFDIEALGGSDAMLVVAFACPFSSKFGYNRVNVACLPRGELHWGVFRHLLEDSIAAFGGELVRREAGIEVQAHMTDGSHAVLIVDCA